MNYFRTKYEIPLHNWLMISENGFNLKYLKKNQRLIFFEKKRLLKIYNNILNSLVDVDISLYRSYNFWINSLIKFRIGILSKKNSKFINSLDVKSDIELRFREYLNDLSKQYQSFKIKEYYFNPKYKELFKELTGKEVFKEINDFKNIKFYDWVEYYEFCKNYKDFHIILYNKEFQSKFILSREIEINSLVELDELLSDVYVKAGKYNDYQFKRIELFDIQNIKSVKEKTSKFIEVVYIGKILGQTIDAKSVTLAMYEQMKIAAKEINDKTSQK